MGRAFIKINRVQQSVYVSSLIYKNKKIKSFKFWGPINMLSPIMHEVSAHLPVWNRGFSNVYVSLNHRWMRR